MTQQLYRHGLLMRAHYEFPKVNIGGWFPRHMQRGLYQIQGKLHSVDGIIEVHDARVPITGRNDTLKDIGIIKPSVLVFNKVDLISEESLERLKNQYKSHDTPVLFTNCKAKKDNDTRALISTLIDVMNDTTRYNRADRNNLHFIILGIPNVGKSSIINALRNMHLKKKSSAEVAPKPGVTRHVMDEMLVNYNPRAYIKDTPGILTPRIESVEAAYKLSLANVLTSEHLNADAVADYLLFWLNKRGRHEYVSALDLDEPTDDFMKLLKAICFKKGFTENRRDLRTGRNRRFPAYNRAVDVFVNTWRKGGMGCCLLDDEKLGYYQGSDSPHLIDQNQ